MSAQIRLAPDLNYGRVVADAIAYGAEGMDLAIIYLPVPYSAAVMEALAETIRDSGLWRST